MASPEAIELDAAARAKFKRYRMTVKSTRYVSAKDGNAPHLAVSLNSTEDVHEFFARGSVRDVNNIPVVLDDIR